MHDLGAGGPARGEARLLAYLTREGIGIDFGRQANGITTMEIAAASSAWE